MYRNGALRPALKRAFAGLRKQEIVALARYAVDYPGTVQMWFGESDVVTAEAIRREACRSLTAGDTFYPDVRGLPKLRTSLSDYLSSLSKCPISESRVLVTASGMAGLSLSLNALVGPEDHAIIVGPVWPNPEGVLTLAGAQIDHVDLDFRPQTGWQLDIERLESAITPRTRCLFLNSPGNPTGWMCTREEQQAVLDIGRRYGVWIVADEVYHRITYDEDLAPSFLDIAEEEDAVIVLNSFSKTWAMTGWRVGWLIAPPTIVEQLEVCMEYMTSGVTTFAQHGCVAALSEGEQFVKEFRGYCARGRGIIEEILAHIPRIRHTPAKGAFYAFFEVEGVTDS